MRSFLLFVGVMFAACLLPVSDAHSQDTGQDIGQDPKQDSSQNSNAMKLSDVIFLASQGNMDAQFEVGKAYFTGNGIALDKNAAVTFFKMSAEQGHTTSESLMGAFYAYGEGVEIDFEKSGKWYRRAAVKGNASAQLSLGGLYKEGLGVPKSNITAYVWFAISNAQDNKPAASFKTELEAVMSQEDIIAAQELAIKCLVSDYKNCG